LPPEIRIILYAGFVVCLFFIRHLTLLLIILAFLLVLLTLLAPFMTLKKGWVPISFLLLFTFISNLAFQPGKIYFQAGPFFITDEGLNTAFLRTIRFFLMIAGAKLLAATTSPDSIVSALGRLLGPLRKFRIPVDDFIEVLGLTMKSLPGLRQEIVSGCSRKTPEGHDIGLFDRLKLISSQLVPVFVRSMRLPERHFEKETGDAKDSRQRTGPAVNEKGLEERS
jgi:energy-coupling factor transport system permease protein